jgi:hypothetical protein
VNLTAIGLVISTRPAFSEWRVILICGGLFMLGLSLYLYLPIASMTNPPVNWGYPRTVDGFFHVVMREQYEKGFVTNDARRFLTQTHACLSITGKEFGWLYLSMAIIPFCFLHRLSADGRRWILGLLPPYVCLAFLMLAVLNPSMEMQSLEMVSVYFSASYIVLALATGHGLLILGNLLTRTSDSNRTVSP